MATCPTYWIRSGSEEFRGQLCHISLELSVFMLWHTHCPAGGPMSSGCSGATGMSHVPGLPRFLGFPCRILQYSKIINVLLWFWCCGWSVYCTCNKRPPTLRLYTYRRASGFKLKKKKDTATPEVISSLIPICSITISLRIRGVHLHNQCLYYEQTRYSKNRKKWSA